MFSKKLLTLACVVAILAFGGCIFIPSGQTHPLPPRLQLPGVRTIQVAAVNSSESHHIDPAGLTQAVADKLNFRTSSIGVKAAVQKQAETGDAILNITILSEAASPPPTSSSQRSIAWTFSISVSATLTRQDGQVLWSQTNADYLVTSTYPSGDPAAIWNEPTLQHWLAFSLSDKLVARMLYGR